MTNTPQRTYYIQLIWNREFDWVHYGPTHADLDDARTAAYELRGMGDGERVKEVRVVDDDDNVVWESWMGYGEDEDEEEDDSCTE